jgi:hypothetical protein
MNVAELIDRLNNAPVDGEHFRICSRLEGCYIARAPSGRAAVLVPCADGGSPVGRATGAILISFRSNVSFDVDGTTWSSSAVVLECLDESVLYSFAALAIDLTRQFSELPSPLRVEQVLRALAVWERLLRSHSVLSEERQLGLWGELEIIRAAPSLDGAVRAWNPDPNGVIDFIHAGCGLEVKTGTTRLRHSMSQRQAEATDGDLRVLLASLWVVPDVAGVTLASLASAIAESTAEVVLFEQKLLAAGFSRRDADTYSRRLSMGGPPMLFEGRGLPRIRAVDGRISSIRYVVDLDPDDALTSDQTSSAMAQLCGLTWT